MKPGQKVLAYVDGEYAEGFLVEELRRHGETYYLTEVRGEKLLLKKGEIWKSWHLGDYVKTPDMGCGRVYEIFLRRDGKPGPILWAVNIPWNRGDCFRPAVYRYEELEEASEEEEAKEKSGFSWTEAIRKLFGRG